MDGINRELTWDRRDLKERTTKMSEIEEGIDSQKAKAMWLRLGDGNNTFFSCYCERQKHE